MVIFKGLEALDLESNITESHLPLFLGPLSTTPACPPVGTCFVPALSACPTSLILKTNLPGNSKPGKPLTVFTKPFHEFISRHLLT